MWVRVRVQGKEGWMNVKAINGDKLPINNTTTQRDSNTNNTQPSEATQEEITSEDVNTIPQEEYSREEDNLSFPGDKITNNPQPTNIPFNPTKNQCGQECIWYKGLCDTGMTCAFYNNDCYARPWGYPFLEAVCVPLSAMNTRVKQHDCPPDRGGSAQPRITKLDGSPWTPNQNNINELCNPNSPIPTNTITSTLTPTPTNQPPKQDVCGPVDVNNDSRIDIIDFSAFARKFNSICR